MPEYPVFLYEDETDPNTPMFYEVKTAFEAKFAKSPWAPDMLVAPDPSTITGQIDMLRRKLADPSPTMAMEVIKPEQVPTIFNEWADK